MSIQSQINNTRDMYVSWASKGRNDSIAQRVLERMQQEIKELEQQQCSNLKKE